MASKENDSQAEVDQLEELDLTPYEEDDDATLHRKLVAAKMARKRAEEDLKLLCNRIGLLKSEEGKVMHLFSVIRSCLGSEEDQRDEEESDGHRLAAKTEDGTGLDKTAETTATTGGAAATDRNPQTNEERDLQPCRTQQTGCLNQQEKRSA